MRILTMAQGSNDWHQAKLGLPSASKAGVLITPTGKQTANQTRRTYALNLAIERITKRPTFTPKMFSMERGRELEPQARIWYYLETKRSVQEVGFVLADGEQFGCSPDGLVGDDGAIEIKCPGLPHFASIVMSGEIDHAWMIQCQFTLLVTGRKWIDFVLYTDVEPFTGWIKRIERDEAVISTLRTSVAALVDEINEAQAELMKKGGITEDMLMFDAPVFNDNERVDFGTDETEGGE